MMLDLHKIFAAINRGINLGKFKVISFFNRMCLLVRLISLQENISYKVRKTAIRLINTCFVAKVRICFLPC